MQVVRSLEETSWRRFIAEHPSSSIFHTPEMFQVFARTQNHRSTLWAVVDDDSHVLALLLPVQITLSNVLHRLTTRAVVYGGVLCAPGEKGLEALRLLLRTYKREVDGAPLFTELRNLSDLGEARPILQEHGFVYEDHLNYLVDLNRPAEKVLQSMGRSARKKIRKGLRDGFVQITEVKNRDEFDCWYGTLQKTYHHAQVPLADRSLFEGVFDELCPRGMAKFLQGKVNGETVVCSVELIYKDTVYGWYGGMDRQYSQYVPNELLMWHIFQWGAENGYTVYDFGGAGKPDEEYGVRDFKAKFGGTLVNYGRNICVHAPALLHLSRWGYAVYRQLFLGGRYSEVGSL